MKGLLVLIFTGMVFLSFPARSQYVTKYPEIPRIDVHSHVGNNYPAIRYYLEYREEILQKCKADVAMWINLNSSESGGESGIDTISDVSKGRIMTCISDYRKKVLTHKPEDIEGYLKKGYVGYKIWQIRKEPTGVIPSYLDDPNYEPVFASMEKAGMIVASTDINDPCAPFGDKGQWRTDPVRFWRSVIGLERVLQRHPDLVVVGAHCLWLTCQDAQIDFLRYLFNSYPNLYIDCSVALTEDFYRLPNRENLRYLFIEYADRILFGTDISTKEFKNPTSPNNILRYSRAFQVLETDDYIDSAQTLRGLDLPKAVLEKIYFRNALELYPGLSGRMKSLGYKI